ncbi:hypothetical protein NC652_040662 [Populus alba x Populus x berolinensis]|nr:hypothetical protein NC652_040662 [Populus alba x Populus x berolinensis]
MTEKKRQRERGKTGGRTDRRGRKERGEVLVDQPFHTVIFICNPESATVNQRAQQHHHEVSAERGER